MVGSEVEAVAAAGRRPRRSAQRRARRKSASVCSQRPTWRAPRRRPRAGPDRAIASWQWQGQPCLHGNRRRRSCRGRLGHAATVGEAPSVSWKSQAQIEPSMRASAATLGSGAPADTGAGLGGGGEQPLRGLGLDDLGRWVVLVEIEVVSTGSVAASSPSAMMLEALSRTSSKRIDPASTISWKARANRKPPTRTLEAPPQIRWAATRPRRSLEPSTTSSCNKLAVLDELDRCSQLQAVVAAGARPGRSVATVRSGRSRLPPAADQVIGQHAGITATGCIADAARSAGPPRPYPALARLTSDRRSPLRARLPPWLRPKP